MEGILAAVINVCCIIAIIIVVVYLVKDIIQIIKGDSGGSILKLIIKIVVVLLLIGLMLAFNNWESLTKGFQSAAEKTVGILDDEIGKAVGG